MLSRIQVLDTIKNLPEQFSIDELIDKLLFMEKVELGLKDSLSGNVFSKEQTKQKWSKWLK